VTVEALTRARFLVPHALALVLGINSAVLIRRSLLMHSQNVSSSLRLKFSMVGVSSLLSIGRAETGSARLVDLFDWGQPLCRKIFGQRSIAGSKVYVFDHHNGPLYNPVDHSLFYLLSTSRFLGAYIRIKDLSDL
jgi:hypothetical protein